MSIQIQFSDKCVSYDTFINDLATALVPKLRKAMEDSRDVISQREAFRRYGQGNVLRWRRKEQLIPVAKRPLHLTNGHGVGFPAEPVVRLRSLHRCPSSVNKMGMEWKFLPNTLGR